MIFLFLTQGVEGVEESPGGRIYTMADGVVVDLAFSLEKKRKKEKFSAYGKQAHSFLLAAQIFLSLSPMSSGEH